MKLKEIILYTNKRKEMKDFYTNVLGMKVLEESESQLSLKVGRSILTLKETEQSTLYHFAFMVKESKFQSLTDKITNFTPKIAHVNGSTTFYSQAWQCQQIYYYDPQGNIIEILAASDKQEITESVDSLWINIQEIGLVVQNMDESRHELSGIANQYDKESDLFSFYGDKEGVFVLVKEGRNWFPTNKQAEIHPIEIIIEEKLEEPITLPHLPYKITASMT